MVVEPIVTTEKLAALLAEQCDIANSTTSWRRLIADGWARVGRALTGPTGRGT
jgi:hypothetical protein